LELGNVNYTGNFTGFIYDFVLNGSIQSSAGSAFADLNFKYDKISKTSFVNGQITTETLKIGKLTGNEKILGEISANARVEGTIQNNKVVGDVKATVNKIYLNGYTYQDITIDGEVNDKLFDGKIKINDPNLKLDFSGKVDLNNEIPTYDFISTVYYANLGTLNFYKKEIEVSLKSNLNVKGQSLDDIIGDATLSEVVIKDGNTTYTLKSLSINAGGDSLNKNLSIRSDLLDADFKGNYSLAKLPLAIQDMITIYVQGGQISSEELANAQNVDFNVQVKDAKTLTSIFYPDISEIKNLEINGDLNTLSKKFFSRTTIEKFTYSGINFDTSSIEVYTKNNKLNFFAKVTGIELSNSLKIPITVLEGDFSKDSLNYNLKIGRDTDPERLNLYAGAFINDSIIRLNVLPSEIFLNNERWEIQPNNSLMYDYENLIAENFTLQHFGKSIGLTSTPDKEFGTILKFQLKNILIEDITQLLKYNGESLQGVINANVNMSSNFTKPSLVGSGSITDFVLNGEKIGNADVTASMLYPNERLNFNVMLKGENKLRAFGYYSTNRNDSLYVNTQISKIPVAVAEPFTRGLFSEMQGDLSGEIIVTGTLQKPLASGYSEIKKGGLKVDYLGTNYFFPYLKLQITEDKISIIPTSITDKFSNEGTISGSVSHKNFSDFYFNNLTINSEKLLFMETSRQQNPDFWGKAIGEANVSINGPIENLNILVNAKPMKDENVETIVYLPTFSSGNVSKHNFITFVNRNDTLDDTQEERTISVVNFDMFLDINQDSKVIILLNSEESDVLEAKGNGRLHIEANTIDKLEMNGTITVSEGSYNFSFENLLTKKFILRPGGTIEFERDPYKAELNLTAIYKADKVKETSLTGTIAGVEVNAIVNVEVLINITGLLESPEINFDLFVPGRSGSYSLSPFDQKLSQVLQDKNELNKQVFGLLWAGQFLSTESSESSQTSALPSPLQSGVNSTMTEFFTNQLSSLFSDWLSEIFPNAELDIGYKKIESGELGSNLEQRQQFDVALQQRIFNDAVIVKIGGTYDYTQSTTNTSNLAGDFEIEYKITPDGRVSIKAFRRKEYDVVNSEDDYKNGLGLFYTKDFDTLGELFSKKE
ncbi:MAG: translocation/assembly module TamB domain-containing protein, partial [Chitinophagales bacterium]